MLAANWEDHDLETNPIINYFADMFHTEQVLRKIGKLMEKKCFYCQECKNCKKRFEYRNVFKQQGFLTFNKHIKVWNVFDPAWCKKNRVLILESNR